MTIVADLHVHTLYSDGSRTVEEIVDMAFEQGLSVIAISDHDTVNAVMPARTYANGRLEVIVAVEMSTQVSKSDLHMLGYFPTLPCESFIRELDLCAKERQNRAFSMVDKLAASGVAITRDEVLDYADGAVIGRPHIARILFEKGIVSSSAQAFEKYLGEDSRYYVHKREMSPQKAISLIKRCNGLAIWAHPGAGEDNFDYLLEDFIACGLDGLEVFHPKHSKEQIDRYQKLCNQHGLLVTGGSDYHDDTSNARLGRCGLMEEDYAIFLSAISKSAQA